MRRPAIVIVTYKRQGLLQGLFDSICELTVAPWRIVVVDNENSEKTAALVAAFAERVRDLWGDTTDDPDAAGGTTRVVYHPMSENTGGSGGFSEGVRVAYDLGAEWFWVMDDDVAVEPEGLARLAKWCNKSDAIQGQRHDTDGGHFYWQWHFSVPFAIYDPFGKSDFPEGKDWRYCNAMCFEGGFFSRRIPQQVGLPDPRFFIYFDDALYGYLASKVCRPIYVRDYVLTRMREVPNAQVGSVRQLNSTSDMTRFHITRNRGYIARYEMEYGDFNPVAYGLGTVLTFAKEMVRLAVVDRGHFGASMRQLGAGWRESRRILHDPSWKPMPPLGK